MISLLESNCNMTMTRALKTIETAIHLVRGQRVMLDSDLAEIYGVSTKRLNQQLKRNRKRFPEDFAFQLSASELVNLRSQIVTSSLHGGRRYRPWVFTEHGALMLASVLSSTVAIDASVRVVRAFVRLRELVSASTELAGKLSQLERRLGTHDEAIAQLFAALRQLIAPPISPKRREIGFHVREGKATYRAKKKLT
jgi:hypothetical protein